MQLVRASKHLLLSRLPQSIEVLTPLCDDAPLDLMLQEQSVVRSVYALLLYESSELLYSQALLSLRFVWKLECKLDDVRITSIYDYWLV